MTTVPRDPRLAEFLRHLMRRRGGIGYCGKLKVEVSDDDGEHIDVRFTSRFHNGPTAFFTITSSGWVDLVIYSNKKKSMGKKLVEVDGWLADVGGEALAAKLAATLARSFHLDCPGDPAVAGVNTPLCSELTNSWTTILHDAPGP